MTALSARTVELYSTFVGGDLFIPSAESAELVKLTENAFRDVNIAFANELAAVCQDLSLNVWEVIELANRHPRVNILQPGPGVGGHCIAVDPYFIIDAAPDSTRLMSSARRINSDRPFAVVREIEAVLDPTRQQTVACLGLSFKPNIDDVRESPAVEVVKLLADLPNIRLVAAEPHIQALPRELDGKGIVFTDALSAIDKADIVVLLVDHRQFSLIDPDFQASDDHPSHNILRGQAFVASVYKALAESPLWPKTLLIVTYDENGGFYDHVPPPKTVDDDKEFEQLGFRVPAFVIGPTVKKGYVSKTQLEHSSVAATLKTRWDIGSLSKRMDATKDISDCIDAMKLKAPVAPPMGMPQVAMTLQSALYDGVGPSSQPMLEEMLANGTISPIDTRNHQARIGSWLEHAVRLGAVRIVGG